MRDIWCSIFITLVVSGCSGSSPSLPENPNSLLDYCGRAPHDFQTANFQTEDTLRDFLRSNDVQIVNPIQMGFLVQFGFELRKFPENLRRYLASNSVGFRILQGKGVADDPTFSESSTFDGRSWNDIPGAGSNPTRIVVNRLYEGHGSINLVLHERAHTLDFYGFPDRSRLSSGLDWTDIFSNEKPFIQLLDRVCGDYCTERPTEAFAEAFAMYFSCEKGRALLSESPRVLKFMHALELR